MCTCSVKWLTLRLLCERDLLSRARRLTYMTAFIPSKHYRLFRARTLMHGIELFRLWAENLHPHLEVTSTVRLKIIGNEIIKTVGKSESCMFPKLPIVFKRTRTSSSILVVNRVIYMAE